MYSLEELLKLNSWTLHYALLVLLNCIVFSEKIYMIYETKSRPLTLKITLLIWISCAWIQNHGLLLENSNAVRVFLTLPLM